MKPMKMSAIRDLSDDEIRLSLEKLKKSYMIARFKHKTSRLENPMELRAARIGIARMLTEARSRKTKRSSLPSGGESEQEKVES